MNRKEVHELSLQKKHGTISEKDEKRLKYAVMKDMRNMLVFYMTLPEEEKDQIREDLFFVLSANTKGMLSPKRPKKNFTKERLLQLTA